MGLGFCSLASGSSGNCYAVSCGETYILVDAGISTKRIHNAIDELGILRSDIKAVLVTHEHSDHIKALPVLTKKNPDLLVYASRGTSVRISEKLHDESALRSFEAGDSFEIGELSIRSLRTSHDAADPVCYVIEGDGRKLIILTDTGYVPDDVKQELNTADIIVLEANHEVNMLKMGSYPYSLKLRILGDSGHLSNETAGQILAQAMKTEERFRHVLLAHLSRENNFPRLASQTVKNILEENSFFEDRHFSLKVLKREEPSCLMKI